MSTPRKPGYGGVEFVDVDTSAVTTSGGGPMGGRKRPFPIPDARAAGKWDFESQIALAEKWAHEILKRAGIKPDGKVNGTQDTPENYAQRFLDYGRSIRDSIRRRDAAGAAAQATVLGAFIREAQLLFKWGDHIEGYEKYRRTQAAIASNPRIAINDDGQTIGEIIARLALSLDQLGDYLPVDDLWDEFQGELDGLHLDPELSANDTVIEYDFKDKRRSMTFKRFQNAISETRGGKSR